jgi:hypothetical protein
LQLTIQLCCPSSGVGWVKLGRGGEKAVVEKGSACRSKQINAFARLDTSHGVSARALLLQQGPSHQAHETTNATASSYVAVEKKKMDRMGRREELEKLIGRRRSGENAQVVNNVDL